MALKRPNRLKYAIYTKEGKEKYAKDMTAYKKAQADADSRAELPCQSPQHTAIHLSGSVQVWLDSGFFSKMFSKNGSSSG